MTKTFYYSFLIVFLANVSLVRANIELNFKQNTLKSHVPFIFELKKTKSAQIVLIQNYSIDTYAEITLGNGSKSFASWMGKNGFYFIFIPSNSLSTQLTINSLDSKNQTSLIGVAMISLKGIKSNIIDAFQAHSYATEIRYQQYIGGKDQRLLAISKFLYSKNIFESNNLHFFSALSSFEAGYTLYELNQFQASIKEFDFSFNSWDKNKYRVPSLESLSVKGLALWKLHKFDDAILTFENLKIFYRNDGNSLLFAQTLNNLGLIYWEKGNYTKSKQMYLNALKVHGFNVNDGVIKAIKENNNKILNSKPISDLINNLALVNDSLGNTDITMYLWKYYLKLTYSLSDRNKLAQAKNNIALLYSHNGEYAKAKSLLNDAILIFSKTNNQRWLSLSQHNLGQVYLKLGLLNIAEIQFNKALLKRNKIYDLAGTLETQIKLVETYRLQDRIGKNLELSLLTLKLANKINHHKTIALIHQNNFFINLTGGNYKMADFEISKAISIAKGNTYKRLQSKLYVNKAKLLILQNRYNPAIEILKFETENLKNIWDIKLLNTANNLLAQAYIKNNELDKSEATISAEIHNIQFYINTSKSDKIRSDLSRMLKETLGIYNTITALQHMPELGFIKTNQMLAEYRDFKKKDKTLQSSLSEASVDDLLTMINNKTLALENNKLSDEDKKHIQNDIIELKAELDFSFTAAINNNTEEFDLKEIQSKLDDDSLVIQFSISDAGGVAWWISQDKFQSFILEDKESIAKLVAKARATFMQKNNNYQSISDLSSKLFTPLKSFNGINKIFLILDEPLNLIPFNALQDPRFNTNISIAENTSIQRVSSIKSVFEISKKHGKDKSIIFADPITSKMDVRLSHIDIENSNTISFNRLLGTKSEALNISKIIDAKILQGFDANKSNLINLDFSNFNIIHFATHAFFHQDISGLSSLVLSSFNNKGEQQPSFLRGLEISNLNLNGKLIVLSGCETGVGNNDNSLGLDGLTQSFMQAGAKNLIASLWKVDDRITEKMMVEFYKNYSQGMSIANALRQAQSKIRDNPRTRHPKYWAGWFLLSN